MSTHGLDLGTLDLASGQVHEDGYTLAVLGSGASFGQSQAAVREIMSMLADGNLVSYDRAGNREATFDVLIEGADGVALQAGEVALRRELYRPNTVTWTPPADFSAPTVFEVITSEMAPLFDDIDELRARRKFRVTLTCAPFARSANPVTVEALTPPPVTPTTATITDCTTTTGWTSAISYLDPNDPYDPYRNSAVTVVDLGADGVSSSANGHTLFIEYTPASPVALTGTPYVSLILSGSSPTRISLTYTGSGPGTYVVVSPVRTVALPGGLIQYWLPANPAKSLQALNVEASPNGFGSTNSALTLSVFDVSRTDTLPQITKRQQSRIVEVSGTERTPASLHVQSQDGTTDLGMTIVHTSPEDGSGYSPPLRRWRQSGGTVTADSTTMSGGREPIVLANPFIAQVPNRAVPEGGYLLAARMRISSGTSAVINWGTSTQIDGATEGYVTDYVSVDFASTGNWYFVPIAALTLPSVRSYSGDVRVLLSSATAELDEAWLFRVDDDCALTVVHNVTKPHMWLDSPDVMSSVPRIWIGEDANRVDASHPGANLFTHGNHLFAPDQVQIFAATSGTENPAVDLTYFPRWPNNAAS